MKRSFTIMVLVGTALAAVMVAASPALAVPPSNDTFVGAKVITIPFSETLDTTEATTDADDAEANADCGAPATEASVWYSLTASSDGGVIVDVSGSNYSAGVIVVTGSPGSFSLQTCGPGSVVFETSAGTTYSILAFDDTPGGGNGGLLNISVSEAPPPPEVSITIDPLGRFDPHTGTATVSGTYTCSGDADFVEIDGTLRQSVGRFVVSGSFFVGEGLTCTGGPFPWSATVFPDNGKFAGGKATASVFIFACGQFLCGEDSEEAMIRLRR
ncbi:MAG TPA: hypothetical protein VGL18_12365 [Actinomycetota bacterium]|jgi:hypothetical protein